MQTLGKKHEGGVSVAPLSLCKSVCDVDVITSTLFLCQSVCDVDVIINILSLCQSVCDVDVITNTLSLCKSDATWMRSSALCLSVTLSTTWM